MALVCLCRGNFYWPPHTTILFCSIFLDKIVLDTLKSRYHRSAPLGMGKPSRSMFLMIFYYIVVRIPLAYLLSYLGFGLNGIWVAVLFSHVVASIAAAITGTVLVKKGSENNIV